MKILLLEDEAMLRGTIEEYLNDLGHQVLSFAEGMTALEALDEQVYDLLILDINVPTITGLEMVEELNRKGRSVPIVFISALWGRATI